MVADDGETKCPSCGGDKTQKLVSRFARYRSEDDRIEALADRMETMADMAGELGDDE
jgi:hypothetical protein